jgi:AcrR family transcriptional regulator
MAAGEGEVIGLRERKKVETRRALEHAALWLSAERGFEAVTIDQIAEAAGVSSRTFFRYFSSKDDVIVRPFVELQAVLGQALAARPADEPVLSALRGAVGELAERLERDRDDLRSRARIMFATTVLVARAQEVRDSWRRLLVEEAARRLGADEVVVVTSGWHAFRARTLVRAALRQPGVSVQTSSPAGRPPVALLARELVCLAALPYHLLRLRRVQLPSESDG